MKYENVSYYPLVKFDHFTFTVLLLESDSRQCDFYVSIRANNVLNVKVAGKIPYGLNLATLEID